MTTEKTEQPKAEKKTLRKFNFPGSNVTIEAESASDARRILATRGRKKAKKPSGNDTDVDTEK